MANILIVDDDRQTIEQLSTMIASFGYAPLSTVYPDHLIEILENEPTDLILMDVNMPGTDGLTLLKQLKSHELFKEVPVIMLTGESDESLLADCFSSGATDFINKPANETVLRARLESALKIRAAINELKLKKIQAEEATELKDKFISLLSHDLRSPLSTVISILDLIKEDAMDIKENRELLDAAGNSCEEMMALIEDLLNMGMLTMGKLKPEKVFVDIGELGEKVILGFKTLAEQKGIRLVNSIPGNSRIWADETLIFEVLRNLLSNAVKFCGKGDLITLSMEGGDLSTIAVSDTGVGISPERIDDIFRYEKSTSTTGTSGERGTGLGLPLCSDIMEAHGGSLNVKSTTDKGSTFYAALPFVKPSILVVDDEECDRQLIVHELLNAFDAVILEAGNGEEALRLIKKEPPHLCIIDINMPVMDGFALLQAIRESSFAEKTKIIMATSSREIEDRERAFQYGCDDYITKPVLPEDIIPRVSRFIYYKDRE